jgi:hypothetical protein
MVNDNVGPKGNQLKGSNRLWGNYLPESGFMAQKEPPLIEQVTGDLGGASLLRTCEARLLHQ